MPSESELGGGAEFDIIRGMLAARSHSDARVRIGPGDDAAVLADGTVLSSDMAIEDVHFRREWLSHEEIGFRSAAAALSDLAAMAAEPVALLLSVGLTDRDREHAPALMRGIDAAAAAAGAIVIGGDVTRSPHALVLDVTVVGRSSTPVSRAGARVGDRLWVTGRLGAAAAAVRAWQRGAAPDDDARRAYARPSARVHEAAWLDRHAALHALIDISDGLAGDAAHIAAASGVRVVIDVAALPVAPSADVQLALDGGDDYELLFAAAAGAVDDAAAAFTSAFGIDLTCIGHVERGDGLVLRSADGRLEARADGGYRHFGAQA